MDGWMDGWLVGRETNRTLTPVSSLVFISCFFTQTLCSYDQYSNLVLENTVERRIVVEEEGRTVYTDIPLGLYVVRGDTVVILGQISTSQQWMQPVSVEEMNERLQARESSSLEWDFDNDLIA